MSKAKAFQYRPPAPLYGETDAATLQQAMERSAAARQHRTIKSNAPVTKNVTTKAPTVTESVTPEPNESGAVTKRVTLLEARVAQLEALVETMCPKSAAERKRASRERKKQPDA